MTQWIVVDDTDSAITYNTSDPATPWSAVNNSIPGTVDLDNAIFQTGHVLSSNGSLSFSFTGTDIEVFGVFSKLNPDIDDIFELSWTCLIDNIAIPINRSALDGFPWTSYCSQAGMTNESHDLHVNVYAKEKSQFWLDYIRYVPLPGTVPESQTILVDSTDHTIQYGTGWETLMTAKVTENEPVLQNPDMTPDMTPDTDSMTFTFSGTGITWYSLTLQAIMRMDNKLPGAFPQEAGSALITLDGEPRNVTIPINGSSDDPSYDMPLFHYDGLDPSTEHVLTATYQPDTSGMRTPPLTLDFLLVQTGPDPAPGSSSPGVMSPSASAGVSGAAPNPTSASQALSEKSHPVRASTIAGAVLGPLLFVLATLLAVCYWRQRRQRARTARRAMTHRAAKLAFPREAPSPDDNDSQPADSESYAMHTSESAHDYARAGLASPGALAGSRFVEDMGAGAGAAQRPFTPRRHSVDYPWETVLAPVPVPASAGAQSVLVDYSGREALQGPSSTSSVTNPFRRMNLASPSNGSFSTLSHTTSNPFRGGPLTPSAQRGG